MRQVCSMPTYLMNDMYNREVIDKLTCFIAGLNGIADKSRLAAETKEKFCLTRDRSVYYNDCFSIRFSKARSRNFSNTVLSLSSLQKYDDKPFFVCLVTPNENFLMLANSSFLKRVSHSSQELRIDNIRGSFNGGDIMDKFAEVENVPENFEYLFSSHENYSFEENLARLVEATNNISPSGMKFVPDGDGEDCIMRSVDRAVSFLKSNEYVLLDNDLCERVRSVESEIVIASFIENVNLRGRIIEYLIKAEKDLREALVKSLKDNSPLPPVFTADKLGDYEKDFGTYLTETDIKTKILFLSSNPKAYNLDKLLEFLSREKSVYLIYIVAIDSNKKIRTRLCSIYNKQLLSGTHIIKHWAGRNSRGVTQFNGEALTAVIEGFDPAIDEADAKSFVREMLDQ